jgi:hypothetical protein
MSYPVLFAFGAITVIYLFLDLGFFHKEARTLSFRQAL